MLRTRERVTIPPVPSLAPRERAAVEHLLERLLEETDVPILGVVLFGSKARGDYDARSDVDLLLICDVHPDERERASEAVARVAESASHETGEEVEPWAVAAADLEEGARTPMLVDALEDGIPLWPADLPPLRPPFTPADAAFCARCLLDWVREGGPLVRQALAEGRREDAAERIRDDITRLATAALLATGDTRHRRLSSLRRFEERFVRPRIVSPRALPALAWAAAAYPENGGRGMEHPPVNRAAAETADVGFRLAVALEAEIVPWILDRLRRLGG